jgi:hypothetical protein
MHAYATESVDRRRFPLIAVLVSVGAAWLLNRALQLLGVVLPWWVDAPSVVGFYEITHALFTRRLWRLRIVRRIVPVKTPDLNGMWLAQLVSSDDDHGRLHEGIIEIRQDWTRISIELRTDESRSWSTVATVATRPGGPIELCYQYMNEPLAGAPTELHAHRGTATLMLTPDGTVLEGEYYTGRDRQSYGTLRLERQ